MSIDRSVNVAATREVRFVVREFNDASLLDPENEYRAYRPASMSDHEAIESVRSEISRLIDGKRAMLLDVYIPRSG